MRRLPKETVFQQQMNLRGSASPEEYQVEIQSELEEHKELYPPLQRYVNKRFL
ncbi:hypothetical protein [Lihuaxuella thermophila]|uniref:Uncharacterized protein n=1 Tax=Lihuaxuella thermophila TaxID=1173111 RepID=A0A1H8AQN8_9BACL|nr:hypothetical protein [Lihuaxuella thermophila]SEM72883.1 hypothetical protein SAMN05444955_101295 [Lihuaxuella thermophila]